MELVSRVDSPHVIKVLEFFEGAHDKVSVIEIIDGPTLEDYYLSKPNK